MEATLIHIFYISRITLILVDGTSSMILFFGDDLHSYIHVIGCDGGNNSSLKGHTQGRQNNMVHAQKYITQVFQKYIVLRQCK